MNSYFQEKHSKVLKEIFSSEGVYFIEELQVGRHNRIDLGTMDQKYGIEIKSGVVDLKSGCGLNQEAFAFPYIVIPEKNLVQAIGWLYVNGMNRTGVICIDDNDKYFMAKAARCDCKKSPKLNYLDELFGFSDEVMRLFYRHRAMKYMDVIYCDDISI